ncbi:uncharacterized protein FOBCDRAFT_251854 [Fusarium oxysporum Fo47]|uniref:Uncharacterized protein n=1 Tax=Fusarium oxysporum Fo47 TaxID=660027 RepID=W9JC08_FUSOX|nr:uncharacterized protein FOBCDRAFT_251854 [Fusarium oxysporum Fo47]EWZ29396.1 hypothetical protein FOZG_17023 [Fusarium oxysporum Fo47]WJG35798.1 hypothetical protein FOBCDRAFT_251854 [Fusarium oxysporum Fo47]
MPNSQFTQRPTILRAYSSQMHQYTMSQLMVLSGPSTMILAPTEISAPDSDSSTQNP